MGIPNLLGSSSGFDGDLHARSTGYGGLAMSRAKPAKYSTGRALKRVIGLRGSRNGAQSCRTFLTIIECLCFSGAAVGLLILVCGYGMPKE